MYQIPLNNTMGVNIVNIVTSSTLGQPIDLNKLCRSLDVFDYDPEGYHGGYLHLSQYTATIYRSGKYIVPGVRSFDDIPIIHKELIETLDGVLDVHLIRPPIIKNIVASEQLVDAPDLNRLCMDLFNFGLSPDYEPESFPGLILKLDEGTINLFASGKYILLGTTSQDEVKTLNGHFLSIIKDLI